MAPHAQTTPHRHAAREARQQSGAAGTRSDFSVLPRFSLSGVYGKDLDAFATKAQTLPLPVRGPLPPKPTEPPMQSWRLMSRSGALWPTQVAGALG